MSLESELLRQAAEMAGERGDWDSAIRFFRELVDTQPEDAPACLGLAWALRGAGRMEAAGQALDHALEMAPAAPEVLRAFGTESLGNNRPAEALAFFRAALSRAPEDEPTARQVRQLEAGLPAALTPELSARLMLARRALARQDADTAAEHHAAVLAALPELAELRQPAPAEAVAPAPEPEPQPDPPTLADLPVHAALAWALEAVGRPWVAPLDADGLPGPAAALLGDAPLTLPPLLQAYLAANPAAAVAALPDAVTDRAGAEALLRRETRLRELARAEQDASLEAAALLPELSPPPPDVPAAARAAGQGYFAPEAAWFRFLLRRLARPGQALPEARALPLHLLWLEPDLIYALAGPRDIPTLLQLPLTVEDGGLFYRISDACIRQNQPRQGLPLARMGESYFQRRNAPFKSLELGLKAGALLEMTEDRAAALECYGRVIAEATQPPLLLAGLQRALALIPERQASDGPEMAPLLRRLLARGPQLLSEALSLLLRQASGTGDQLQRRGIQALTAILTGGGGPGIMLPAVSLGSPALVGHLLRHGGATLPQDQAPATAVNQLAAFASGFTHVVATGAHLADLLRAGDHDGIAAIGGFITRRYGQPFLRPERPGIVTVLGSGNVGDTLLYMAGFAAFVRASGQPVHVLHRASRGALAEFFGAVPGLSFEPIPNNMEVPAPLALNRLAPGQVSLFYDNPWFRGQEMHRLADRALTGNFLWDKLVAVMLSGAASLPERIVVERPPIFPPPHWNEAARQRFAALGLKRGRTVFLSPLANTLFSLTSSRFNHFRDMWREAIALFRQAGFTVVMNATNNNAAETLFGDAGVPELDLDLRELPAFVAECGYFAGVRSGLCDLLALCGLEGVRARNIYMRGAEHCTGLADFGMAEVVADFNAHPPRALAEGLFADWLATRP
jgi:tetratricopeptide (TPR) repeat protein